jgi:Family of unknown function (DUF6221)
VTDAIVEFLTARYGEEQAAVERIEDHSEPWRGEWIVKAGTLYTYNGWCLAVLHDSFKHPWNPQVLAHITRYDPARVLADIAAKRGLLEAHGAEDDCVKEVTWPDLRRICWMDAGEPCPSLRWLAAPYAGHPEFRPEWRIDA